MSYPQRLCVELSPRRFGDTKVHGASEHEQPGEQHELADLLSLLCRLTAVTAARHVIQPPSDSSEDCSLGTKERPVGNDGCDRRKVCEGSRATPVVPEQEGVDEDAEAKGVTNGMRNGVRCGLRCGLRCGASCGVRCGVRCCVRNGVRNGN